MKHLVAFLLATLSLTAAARQPAHLSDSTAATDSVAPRKLYHYSGEVQTSLAAGRHNPFWLVANRYGLSSIDRSNGYIRGGVFHETDTTRRFSWGFGVDLAGAYDYTSSFVVQQLYGELRYRSLNLLVGSKELYSGILDPDLTSGDLTFSTNARPIPQVRLEMPRYEWVPYTRHWLAARWYFSFGYMTDSRWQRDQCQPYDQPYTEHRLFHSKGLFLRVGDTERFPLTFEGGLEMGCQFGGTAYHYNEKEGRYDVIKFPHSLKDIFKSVIPMGGGDANDKYQEGDMLNAYGNHAGQWSAAISWEPNYSPWHARLYYQHFFEDHSMLFFDHAWKDMLLGAEVKFPANPIVSKLAYEYLITRDQSGAVYWDWTPEIPDQISGADDYYNNINYGNWQQWGQGLGNPLVVSPIYNTNHSLLFYHNRIKAHHIAWEGEPSAALSYRVKLSYTRSWGSYRYPSYDVRHSFNGLLELDYHPRSLGGWQARLGIGADGGNLLGGSFGAQLTISKTGCF